MIITLIGWFAFSAFVLNVAELVVLNLWFRPADPMRPFNLAFDRRCAYVWFALCLVFICCLLVWIGGQLS